MSRIPATTYYTQTHEWVRQEDNGNLTVGISDYAQSQLGEIVFVGLPEIGEEVQASDEVCSIESVKTASDVYSPVSGKIVQTNEELSDAPAFINSDPYGDGWLFQIEPSDVEELEELLGPEAYAEHVENQED